MNQEEPMPETEGSVHKERLTPQGWPTGYALCDTDDGTFEGGTLAHNSSTATCEKCIDWEGDEDEPEATATRSRRGPHD